MEFRLKTWVIWPQGGLLFAMGAFSALDAEARTGGLRVFNWGMTALIWIIAVAWTLRAARQVRPWSCVLAISKEGVKFSAGNREAILSWEEVREAGRPRPWDEKTFAPLVRANEVSGDLKRRFGVSFQNEDVLPVLLAFYARNPGLLQELPDRDAMARRMRGLRNREARRARAHERRLNVLRIRREKPPVTERGHVA